MLGHRGLQSGEAGGVFEGGTGEGRRGAAAIRVNHSLLRAEARRGNFLSFVGDRGFLSLMKTGRPGYYVPSASTVARDVKTVFARSRTRIAKMLQVSNID